VFEVVCETLGSLFEKHRITSIDEQHAPRKVPVALKGGLEELTAKVITVPVDNATDCVSRMVVVINGKSVLTKRVFRSQRLTKRDSQTKPPYS